jgi:hypothetical protein
MQNLTNGHEISKMSIKYINIFHSKDLKILPNWDFWFENWPLATLNLSKFRKKFSMTPNCSRARVLLTATTGRIWHRWKQGDQIGRIFVHRTNFFFTQLLIKNYKSSQNFGPLFSTEEVTYGLLLTKSGFVYIFGNFWRIHLVALVRNAFGSMVVYSGKKGCICRLRWAARSRKSILRFKLWNCFPPKKVKSRKNKIKTAQNPFPIFFFAPSPILSKKISSLINHRRDDDQRISAIKTGSQ